jgi:hypothetical protein
MEYRGNWYTADKPDGQFWLIEAKAKRVIKKRFGNQIKLERDHKPRGQKRRKFGQYSLHMHQFKDPTWYDDNSHYCIAKNLTLDDITNIEQTLDALGTPETLPDGQIKFPRTTTNQGR